MAPKITEEAKELRRIAILEAAEQCFARQGYYETSIDDIVRESLMSKGAIYTYFESKEEIFISLMNHMTARSFSRVRERLSQLSSAKEKLNFLIENNYKMYSTSKNIQRVHYEFWLYSSSFPKLQELMQERAKLFEGLIAEIIREGIANGEFKSDIDIDTISSLYWKFRDGIWLHQLTVGDEDKFKKSMLVFEQILFDYLCK